MPRSRGATVRERANRRGRSAARVMVIADLVGTPDNPLLDIGALADGKRIDLVIRRGRIVRRGRT